MFFLQYSNVAPSTMSQGYRVANISNNFPDCFVLKLKSQDVTLGQQAARVVVRPASFPAVLKKKDFSENEEILLTMCFNQMHINIMGGRLLVGLRRGNLQLILNGATDLIEWRYGAEQKDKEEVQSTVEVVHERQLQASRSPSLQSKNSHKKTEKVVRLNGKVTTYGGEKNPGWRFEETSTRGILQGLLKDVTLTKLAVTEKEWSAQITFKATTGDISVNGTGIWPNNISDNKLAVFEMYIAKMLLREFFAGPISAGSL